MKRSLRFWTRYTWESVEVALIGMLALAVFSALGAEGLQWRQLASTLPYFLFLFAVFTVVIINASSHMLYIPLLLSMGETRRGVFCGFQYYRVLVIAVTLVVSGLLWLLVGGEVSAMGLRSLPTMTAALVLSSSLGSFIGTIYVKWRWASVVLLVLMGGAVGAVGGFLGATTASGELLAETVNIAAVLQPLPWPLAVAAAAALAGDLAFQWLLLRRREVKL